MPLTNRLKEFRARLGVNQSEMGKLVGVSDRPSALLNGATTPKRYFGYKLAQTCNTMVEELFIYEEDDDEKIDE